MGIEAIAPLASTGLISSDFNLILAVLIGLGFGFVLERAGFGSAKIMVDQWYGKNWSVGRVMFTAIVVAMLGMIILDQVGIMPFGSFHILNTYLYPQIIGGLILGVGFVIGGYCPGTSFVALASGNKDALFYILGLFVGVFVFYEGPAYFFELMNEGAMGRITLNQLFGWNLWTIGVVILLIALAFNYFSGKIKSNQTT